MERKLPKNLNEGNNRSKNKNKQQSSRRSGGDLREGGIGTYSSQEAEALIMQPKFVGSKQQRGDKKGPMDEPSIRNQHNLSPESDGRQKHSFQRRRSTNESQSSLHSGHRQSSLVSKPERVVSSRLDKPKTFLPSLTNSSSPQNRSIQYNGND